MNGVIKRNLLKRLAPLVAGLLLFAQLVVAAQACMLRPQPIAAQMPSDGMATEECSEAPVDPTPCLVNCLKADQPANPSADYHFPVIALSVSAVAELSALIQPHSPAIPSPFCAW